MADANFTLIAGGGAATSSGAASSCHSRTSGAKDRPDRWNCSNARSVPTLSIAATRRDSAGGGILLLGTPCSGGLLWTVGSTVGSFPKHRFTVLSQPSSDSTLPVTSSP